MEPTKEDLRVSRGAIDRAMSNAGVELISTRFDKALFTTFASAIAAEREKVWNNAIAIAKQPINTLGWGSASGGVAQKVIVDSLEAAALAIVVHNEEE